MLLLKLPGSLWNVPVQFRLFVLTLYLLLLDSRLTNCSESVIHCKRQQFFSAAKQKIYFLCFVQTIQQIFFGLTSLILGSKGFKPIIRYLYCSLVRSAASCVFLGRDNRPASKRLYRSKNPVPIHKSPLHRSERFLQNKKSVLFSNRF